MKSHRRHIREDSLDDMSPKSPDNRQRNFRMQVQLADTENKVSKIKAS